jgi:hypothetical protein
MHSYLLPIFEEHERRHAGDVVLGGQVLDFVHIDLQEHHIFVGLRHRLK